MSLKERINRKIKVRDRIIGPGEPIFLTAEIGAAHGGSMENAKILIQSAAESGCDGADIFMANGEEFFYIPVNVGTSGTNPHERWKKFSFSPDQWRELVYFGKEKGIIVYPTPLDVFSVRQCAEIGVEMINVNSDDINNILFLEEAAKLGIPITLHDIDQSLAEIDGAIKTLLENGAKDIILLHSTLETGDVMFGYETANLNVMKTYQQAYGDLGVLAGCVEHTTSDYLIYAVAALQPALISKHIKIDESVDADTIISVKIDDLKTMVQRIRNIEVSLGNGHNQKLVNADGSIPRRERNKVLVSSCNIPAGKVIERRDLAAKRPGTFGGLHPWHANVIVGSKAKHDLKANTLLSLNLFEEFIDPDYKFPETHHHRVEDISKAVMV
jgi:N,N'-diacetyllegionaminate synthase